MNEIREILTKAVVAKGKKTLKLKCNVKPENDTFSILGCWVINHEYCGDINETIATVNGTFEINIWYAYDNNSRTEVARQIVDYSDTIKVRQIVKEVIGPVDIIVRILKQPTCTNASIVDDGIEVDIVTELIVEVLGETKMLVTAFTNIDPIDIDDDFENEINENFINENQIG